MPELEPSRDSDRHCLLIDQGSSRIKWIGAVQSALSANWDLDLTTFGEGDIDDFERALDGGELMPPEEVLLTSVASAEKRGDLEDAVEQGTSATLVRLTSQKEACGIRNGYRTPERLGADRWMAILGAAHLHGLPLIVMDLGTATTLDAVDAGGRHRGGLILPGPGSMRSALQGGTAIDFSGDPSSARARGNPGTPQTETRRAIDGGITTAQLGALKQFQARFVTELGEHDAKSLHVIVTGGAANAILGRSDEPLTHDPLLVFRGMLISRYGSGGSDGGNAGISGKNRDS